MNTGISTSNNNNIDNNDSNNDNNDNINNSTPVNDNFDNNSIVNNANNINDTNNNSISANKNKNSDNNFISSNDKFDDNNSIISSNKNFVPIPSEILLLILSYLNKDYISLHNCLLVNKFWFTNTIEILYSNPFKLLQSKVNNTTQQMISNTLKNSSSSSLTSSTTKYQFYNTVEDRIVKLIDLYVKCLRKCEYFKEIENRLNEKGIFYVYYNFVSLYLHSSTYNTIFSPNNNNIKKSIYTYNPYSVVTKRTLVIELFKKFLYQKKNLIELSLNTNSITDFKKYEMNGIDQDLLDIFKYQIFTKEGKEGNNVTITNFGKVDNIRTLICGGIKFDMGLKLLLDNLKLTSIENFIMDFSSKYHISSDMIVEFLSSQKKLKKFCVIGSHYEQCDIFYKLSLSQQNVLGKLTSLEFYGIIFNNNNNNISTTINSNDNFGMIRSIHQQRNFNNNIQEKSLMNGIICCHNLQELVFENCVNLTSDTLHQLRDSKFIFLKRFTFRYCSGKSINLLSSHNSLATLIRNSIGIIEEIRFGRKLKWCMRTTYEVYNIILEEMMKCKNLKVVECCIIVDIIEEFLIMLQTCKTLEKVIISIDCELSDNEIFWKRLGKSLSKNRYKLKELSICIGGGGNPCENDLWIETFEWFFNSCNIPIDILKFPMCYSIDENYLKIIERYAKRVGGIKKIMLCESFLSRENVGKLNIEGVKNLYVCCDDTEFGDDDLVKRFGFRQ